MVNHYDRYSKGGEVSSYFMCRLLHPLSLELAALSLTWCHANYTVLRRKKANQNFQFLKVWYFLYNQICTWVAIDPPVTPAPTLPLFWLVVFRWHCQYIQNKYSSIFSFPFFFWLKKHFVFWGWGVPCQKLDIISCCFSILSMYISYPPPKKKQNNNVLIFFL